ncbi:MAG: FecR domain-containing protein [Odoribacteraceae bacterium]|jgi:ferric-dicitrate binding protein FerR (iron transport regulator)|nr:FecR domain-containing protein [Odoribacteraceae bacterium]
MDREELFTVSRLILAEIAGIITEQQADRLLSWRKEHPEHEALYQRLKDKRYLKEGLRALERVDGRRAREEMYLRVRREKRRRLVGWIAAAAVIACAAGMFYFHLYRPPVEETRLASGIAPGSPRATLQLADGSIVLLDTLDRCIEQGGVEVAKSNHRQLSYLSRATSDESPLFNEVRVPRGGEFDLVLADGTRVWLNAGSSLRFPVNFSGEERRVFLSGEAYFEVTRDAARPFRVEIAECLAEVLGTEFNLSGYDDDPVVYATLASGSVSFSNGPSSVLLSPGEQGVARHSSDRVEKRRANVEEIVAWKNGMFILEEQTLGEIMQKIARWYDVEIAFLDPLLKEITFKGRVPRHANLDKVLLTLEKTGEARFSTENRTVVVYR